MNRRFPGKLLEDWPAKILSFVAAASLAYYFELSRLETRSLSVPLAVVESGEFAPSSAYPRVVRVTLRGEPGVVGSVREDDLKASIDLSGFKGPGTWRAPVVLEKYGSALDVSPLELSVDPVEVAVSVDRKATRSLPVVPSFRGFLETGYELSSFGAEPRTVEVSGPEGVVQALTEVDTEQIDLSGRVSDFRTTVQLVPPDANARFPGRDYVDVSATVSKALVYRTVAGVSIIPHGLPEGLSLVSVLPQGSIRLSGARSELESMAEADALLSMDLSGVAEPGTYTLAVVPSLKPGLVADSFEPSTAVVTVRRGPSEDAR